MALKDITKPAVLNAIQECVRLGRESFLDKYGFGPAKLYRLVYDGRIYDSKAIVGVAHQYVRAGLGPLTRFSGGAKTVQPVLESLGFTVRVGRAELGDIVLPGEVDDNAFDPSNIEDARKRISRMIAQRHGQRAFRNNLFDAYGGRCAITGCEVPDVLEAAHILPYRGEETNKVKNGLLLRADVHTLFDCGLIAVDEVKMTVLVAPALQDSEYWAFHGQKLRLPPDARRNPSTEALKMQREEFLSGASG